VEYANLLLRALDPPAWLAWLYHPMALLAVGLASAAMAVLSLATLPFLLARIPADYFHGRRRHAAPPGGARWFGRVLKNALGGVLLLAGIAMLFLPGQGILTILAALVFLDFPGKWRLEQRLIARPHVLKTINHLRARIGHPPLELDPDPPLPHEPPHEAPAP
jgi:hypothetical protein